MARGPRYRVAYRRRREGKTDYTARRILATSDKPRYVVRISNKNIVIQLINSKVEGDYVQVQTNSKELSKYGWQAGTKNISSAYLLGVLAGKKAKKAGIDEAYLDLGLVRPTKGSKVFAAVKGAQDAGLWVPCDSEVIPEMARIEGKKIQEYAESIENPYIYERQFSAYIRKGLQPQDLPDHFSMVKTKIEEADI